MVGGGVVFEELDLMEVELDWGTDEEDSGLLYVGIPCSSATAPAARATRATRGAVKRILVDGIFLAEEQRLTFEDENEWLVPGDREFRYLSRKSVWDLKGRQRRVFK